ncbi:MAG: hypothetical protein WBW53_22650 [Terriglobales bacterium]
MKTPEITRDRLFAIVLLLGLLAMTARTATDPDLWWHLRTGQWIVQTGHIPHSDPFSFTRAGRPWVSHEWLSEVLFYELWNHGGAAALTIFSAVITTAGFMLLYLRCPGKKHWAAAATAVGALAAAPSWGVRPQMFTFTLGSLLLWLIERGENRPKLLFWIPLLFLLWLNLHAGFALGPALLLAYGIGLLIETAVGHTPWPQARPILLRVFLLLIACMALVPLNPSGSQLYRYPLDTLRSHEMRSFIVEWFSPDFHQSLYQPLLLVWLLLLTALASFRSRPRGRMIVPLLLTAVAALDAVRHIPIFILVAMPIIAAALPTASSSLKVSRRIARPTWFRPAFLGAIIILMAVFTLVKWVSVAHSQDAREAELFPEKAIAFLQTGDQPQRIFVYYDWGGYAIWKLYPKYRVFVDGRADLYDNGILTQFKTAAEVHTGWRKVLDDWNVDTVLVPPSCALAQALRLDPDWRISFSSSKSIILRRVHSTVQDAELSPEVIIRPASK